MIYYTADLHLGHANVIVTSARPFETVEEMNNALIENWNRVVKDSDDVYIVGDLIFKNGAQEKALLPLLKGKKHLIVGNHDEKWLTEEMEELFESIAPYMEIEDDGHKVVLCHFPMLQWKGARRGSIHVYGHIHSAKKETDFLVMKMKKRALNAGVDINGYRPVTLKQMIANNENYFKAY